MGTTLWPHYTFLLVMGARWTAQVHWAWEDRQSGECRETTRTCLAEGIARLVLGESCRKHSLRVAAGLLGHRSFPSLMRHRDQGEKKENGASFTMCLIGRHGLKVLCAVQGGGLDQRNPVWPSRISSHYRVACNPLTEGKGCEGRS